MTINRIQPETPWNSDLWLEFDPDEPLDATILRKLGFRLAKDDAGNVQYKASENVQQEVLNQAMFAGFPVDQQNTYRLRFKKDDWFGDFGAYTQRAFEGRPNLSIDLATRLGFENRPAFTINVDTRFHKPLLAMEQFTAGLTGGGNLSAPISGFIEFKHHLYCCTADRHVYRLDSWGAPGAATWTQVFQHSVVTAVLRDLIVFSDIMYVAAGETAPYAYTADGTTWVESNRSIPTNDDKAEQFRVINGFLHKIRVPNLHYETTDGRNSGAQWFGPDAIGESQADIQAFELLAQNNSTLFAKEESVFNLPEDGQVQDLYPELQKSREPGNGFHAFVWNQKLLYPTFKGELVGLFDGRKVELTPALRQERRLELNPAISGFLGRIRAMAGTTDYLFVELKKNDTDEYRILVLEERGGAFVWRTLLNLESTTSDELFVSSDSTAGPVLWATFNNVAAYWILPVGPDPLQDSRSRFTGSGTLYEPWLDFGLPTIDKRWSSITFEVAGQSGQTLVMTAVLGDGTTYTRTMTLGAGVTYTRFLFPKGFIHKRLRLELELTTNDDTSTPALISYEIKAYALPPPIRQFQFVVEAMEKGERGGMATQDEMRQHLLALRGAVFPLTYKDPYQRLWPVLHFPPAPFEDTTHNPDMGRWDENWTVMLLEEPTREFELIHGPPPGLVTDVSVSKECGPATINLSLPGPHNITDTITVHNAGPATAQGVVVTLPMEAGTSFVSADHGGVLIGGVIVWNLGNMTSGQTIVLTDVVHVADTVTTDITETATVSVASPTNVSTSTSDSCTVVIQSGPPIDVVALFQDTPGAARFVYTLDRTLGGLTHWIENSVGLPTTGVNAGYAVIDPFDPLNTAVAYVQHNGSMEIYKNVDYRLAPDGGGASWTKVWDVADFNTLTGRSATSITPIWRTDDSSGPVKASIALDSWWWWLVKDNADSVWAFHTHNKFTNFHVATDFNGIVSFPNEWNGSFMGQWDENFQSGYLYNPIAQQSRNGASFDGSHNWVEKYDNIAFGFGNFGITMVLPRFGNEDYHELFIISATGTSTGDIFRTIDLQGSFATSLWGTITGGGGGAPINRLDPEVGNLWIVYSQTDQKFNKSPDTGQTWDAIGFAAAGLITVKDFALWPGGNPDILSVSVGDVPVNHLVDYTTDLATWLDITGDLVPLLGGQPDRAFSITFGHLWA